MDVFQVLADIYNNCDPIQPAPEKFYVDCTEVRGGDAFAHDLCKELSKSSRESPETEGASAEAKNKIYQLFTGHLGCGKSSELEHLATKMGQVEPLAPMKRFLPIVVDMRQYFEAYDVSVKEILLAIVAELAAELREKEDIELKDSYFVKRIQELKDYLLSDVEINEAEVTTPTGKIPLVNGEIPLPVFKFKLQRLRTDPNARTQVRKQLANKEETLRQEINAVFDEARKKLRAKTPRKGGRHYTDFVLILDSLDKIERLENYEAGNKSHEALFIENASLLTGLDAHIVYTTRLSLVRAFGPQLIQLYGRDPFTLPMVKTEERGREHPPYEKGKKRLQEILARRMPPGVAVADVFTDEALDFLIQYSGGHVRSFLLFVREATVQANDTLPISLQAAQKAIRGTVSIFSTSIRTEDWEGLAGLEMRDTQEWDSNNDQQRRLLEQLCVLEYVNGGEMDIFNDAAPWYAVNPIVRQLAPFKRALEQRKNSTRESPQVTE